MKSIIELKDTRPPAPPPQPKKIIVHHSNKERTKQEISSYTDFSTTSNMRDIPLPPINQIIQ